jgi:O-antigen ligase
MPDNYPIPAPGSSAVPSRKSRSKAESRERVRKVAFYVTLGLVFIRCSQIHELITYEVHFDTYLLLVVNVLALVGLIFSKSAGRPVRFAQAYCWLGFSLWIALTVPFSVWRAGSLQVVEEYWRLNVILIFLVGGLTTTWKEFEQLLRVLAISCLINLAMIKFYGQLDADDRMTLPFGSLANSNDFAAHLLMLLPSVLWLALVAKSFKLRVAILALFGYGIYAVLSSASRGALISVAVGVLYFLFSATKKVRLWGFGLIAIMLFAVLSLMPQQAIHRMLSFSKSDRFASEGALESSDERAQLLQDAVSYAFQYPLFGLGPENFRVVEGKKPGMYQPAHNTFAQVACESGFPGFFLFLGGIGSSFLTFWRIRRKFQTDVRAKELAQAAFCMQLMMVTFCLAVGFLNFAYAFHFPLMVGISVAMAYSTERWRSETAPQVQTKQVKKDGKKKRSRKHQKVLRATWSRLERKSSTAA